MTGYATPRWRLILSDPADGASHMALDQALLEAAGESRFAPTLRFYRWSPPALSLGRFQPLDDVDTEACDAEGIDVVRRPSGGKSILHLDDFTYSVVLPAGFPLPDSVVGAYRVVCEGILRALDDMGIAARIVTRSGGDHRRAGSACFAAITQADLECAGKKLCGSAQLRRGGAVLQHGSIMLEDRSRLLFRLLRFEDERHRELELAAFRERFIALSQVASGYSWDDVAAAFRRGFARAFGAELVQDGLCAWERERWRELSGAYRSSLWLENSARSAFPDPYFPRSGRGTWVSDALGRRKHL